VKLDRCVHTGELPYPCDVFVEKGSRNWNICKYIKLYMLGSVHIAVIDTSSVKVHQCVYTVYIMHRIHKPVMCVMKLSG
jgi:hypothetical protein